MLASITYIVLKTSLCIISSQSSIEHKLSEIAASSPVISQITKIIGRIWINFIVNEIAMFDSSSRKERSPRYYFHTPTLRIERTSNFVERNRQGSNFVERAPWRPTSRCRGPRAPAATRSPYYLLKSRLPSHHLSTPRMLSVFARLHLQIEYSRPALACTRASRVPRL